MENESVILEQVHSFKGKFPEIPLPADIDKAALGNDAFFVTLPIGKIGAKSKNGNLYGETVVRQLVEQINTNRPEGMWGHVKDADRGSVYAPPALRWLAAVIDNDGMAWGKAIPITTDAREHLRVAKLTNSAVGTSIYGLGKVVDGVVTEITLETIDLAPASRVGVSITAKVPNITSEMDTKKDNKMAEVTEQLVSELNGKVVTLQETIAARETTISEMQSQIAAIKAVTSDDPVKFISEMRVELNELRGAGFKADVTQVVAEFVKIPTSTEGGKALTEYVVSVIGELSKYKTIDEVKAILNALADNPVYKTVAKALISESQGGSIRVEDKSEGKQKDTEITSETAKKIADKWGVSTK